MSQGDTAMTIYCPFAEALGIETTKSILECEYVPIDFDENGKFIPWNKGLKTGSTGPCSEERKRNISNANKGKKRTEEQKLRMSEKKIGSVPWNKGKTDVQVVWNKGKKGLQTHSEETKKKMSESRKRYLRNQK